jgi:hypothetical protein
MRTIVVDKLASVAEGKDLSREIRVSPDIVAEEGVLVAARVLNAKSRYNTLELTSGRMAQVKKGDVIVGALGHRRALFGYSGNLPTKVAVGDVIQLLNLGGVMGVCNSINPAHGAPFDCEILGGVLEFPYLGERIGVPARVGQFKPEADAPLNTHGVPVIALAGTCMDSGKTAAAAAIVSRLHHNGLIVDAFKATGVALRRDILAMEDAGARDTMIFSDLGVVATTAQNAAGLTRQLLSTLAAGKPDVIIFELGDGLLGAYGVDAILADPELRAAFSAVVLCANDPVAAHGGVQILRDEFQIEPAVVTGPATDNQVGIDIITQRMNVPAFNALTHGVDLADHLQQVLGLAGQRETS